MAARKVIDALERLSAEARAELVANSLNVEILGEPSFLMRFHYRNPPIRSLVAAGLVSWEVPSRIGRAFADVAPTTLGWSVALELRRQGVSA